MYLNRSFRIVIGVERHITNVT